MELRMKLSKEAANDLFLDERSLISIIYIVSASILMTLNMFFYPGFVTWKFFASLSVFPAWLIYAVLQEKRLKLPRTVSGNIHFAFGVVFLSLIMTIVLKERLVGIAYTVAWTASIAASYRKERMFKKANTTTTKNNRLVPVAVPLAFRDVLDVLLLTLISMIAASYAFAYMVYIATWALLPLFVLFFLGLAVSIYLLVYLFMLRPIIKHNIK